MSKFRSVSYLRSFLLLLAVVVLSLSLTACSKDDELSNPTRASILVTHDINGRALTDEERSVLYYCYNKDGLRTFGPAKLAKASQILLQAVPVESTSISMTYYNGDGKVVGFYSQPVQLKIGEIYEINDPAWEDIDSISNLKGIDILQESATRVHTGDTIDLIAMGRFTDAKNNIYYQVFSGLCDWSSSDDSIITNKDAEGNYVGNANSFTSQMAGLATITLTFYNFSDNVIVEVTDATVNSVELEVKSITLPVTLDSYDNNLMATWSDGVVTNISANSSWNSNNTESVVTYLGRIIPVGVINADVEDKSVKVTATYNCGGEAFTDMCSVTVVDSKLKSIFAEPERDEIVVGLGDADVYVYGVYTVNGQEERFPIDDPRLYTVTTSDANIAAVELDDYENYDINGVSPGTATIEVTYKEDPSLKTSFEITVVDGEEQTDESEEESAEESEEESVEESEEESAEESEEESAEESEEESVEESEEESVEESEEESVEESEEESVEESEEESAEESEEESVEESEEESLEESSEDTVE